jgi:uncharacterized membrane protein YkvA (DUF1232 family)
MTERIFDVWKRRAKQLKMETYAIYLAYKDPRVPWYVKLVIVGVVGYLFTPIDKFLDSIPIIGYLDHLILVPIGVALAFKKMIPPTVLTDCREKAYSIIAQKKTANWVTGSIIIAVWFLFASVTIVFTARVMKDWSVVLEWWFRWFTRMTNFPNHIPLHGGF